MDGAEEQLPELENMTLENLSLESKEEKNWKQNKKNPEQQQKPRISKKWVQPQNV